MARKKSLSDMVLRDGTIGGFRLGKPKMWPFDVAYNDPTDGLVKKKSATKIVLSMTLDCSTIKPVDYAMENPDPSKPLILEFHAFILDGVPMDKAPQDDFDRLNFIKYDMVQDILNRSGYDADKDEAGTLRYPLPGLNYIMVTLGEGKTINYAALKDGHVTIGGEDLVKEIREQKKEMTGTLRGILGMKRTDDAKAPSINLLNLRKKEEPSEDETTQEELEAIRAENADKRSAGKKKV